MSMLSAQSDELRVLAGELQQIYEHNVDLTDDEDVTLASSVDAMREAADTIETLRDRLQESYDQVPEQAKRGNGSERESYGEVCGDDRFELIGKAKGKLLECTNIESRPEEVAVLDSILFRCWQIELLDQLRDDKGRWFQLFGTPERAARTLTHVCQFTHGGELCDRCQCYLFGDCDRTLRLKSERKIYDALLEWLRGDA